MKAPRPAARRTLLVALLLALLGHVAALGVLRILLQPPTLLRELAQPMYTRTLQAEAPPGPVAAAPAPTTVSATNRPTAVVRSAQPATKTRAKTSLKPAKHPAHAASAPANDDAVADAASPAASPPSEAPSPDTDAALPQQDTPPEPQAPASTAQATASAPGALPSDAAPGDAGTQVAAAASAPASEASAPADAEPAFLKTWPRDTRLRYHLSGNYRGELHGDAQVLWQREGTRYQAVVQMDVGILLSSRFTSQGAITDQGLKPEVYEEQVRKKRRGVRIGEDVRLNNGTRVPRPNEVQDAASQFVELGHRFATGQLQLTPGGQVNFWLARPGGVDEWTYDVVGEETLHLPRLGPVQAVHLKPRPLNKPRGPIMAEIWFAPSLQYLPVRIRITQGADTFVDLMVDTIDQR